MQQSVPDSFMKSGFPSVTVPEKSLPLYSADIWVATHLRFCIYNHNTACCIYSTCEYIKTAFWRL